MIQHVFLFCLFVFFTASIHALLEIEIEGKHGWAEKLPTKKFTNRFIKAISENTYVTGFHIATTSFIFVFAHFPLLFLDSWTWTLELSILGFVIVHFVFEDFFWFVYNPNFGLRKFKSKHIWWHKKWFLGLPVSYWFSLPIGIVFLALGTTLS